MRLRRLVVPKKRLTPRVRPRKPSTRRYVRRAWRQAQGKR